MGFRPGWFWGSYAAFFETIGALLFLLGFGTQIAGLLLSAEMFVIICWKKINGQKLLGDYELDLLLFVSGLILATMGGGQFAFLF